MLFCRQWAYWLRLKGSLLEILNRVSRVVLLAHHLSGLVGGGSGAGGRTLESSRSARSGSLPLELSSGPCFYSFVCQDYNMH